MEVSADDLDGLLHAATAAHRRMWESASRMADDDCRRPSLLPEWSRGHVLAHWARNADSQSRMLRAAMRGEVAAQYPRGNARRDSEIEAGASGPARLILSDTRAAVDRLEDLWRRMPPDAWSRSTIARAGTRPAWMSVWARWRESEIHHLDLEVGYTHRRWPADFVGLLLPRVMATLETRLEGEITVLVEAIDGGLPVTETTASTADEPAVVRGSASAVLCWLLGRASAAAADLTVTRSGQPWPLPRLRPWA